VSRDQPSGDRYSARPGQPAFEARIETYGDSAVIVALGDTAGMAVNRRVHRLVRAIGGLRAGQGTSGRGKAASGKAAPAWDPQGPPPIGLPVAGYASVLVPFDPEQIGEDDVRSLLDPLLADPLDDAEPAAATQEPLTIPVRYGGEDGPDLVEVADRHGIRPVDVIELHAATIYEVLFLGFAPGFGYMGPVADEIATPRLPSPRPRVPAGSVGIAGNQTCVYPFATPGGWNLVGRTAMRMWDVARTEPALLAPGQRIRFVPER
jgi:KipI family sensor histidine kinase inhibitor